MGSRVWSWEGGECNVVVVVVVEVSVGIVDVVITSNNLNEGRRGTSARRLKPLHHIYEQLMELYSENQTKSKQIKNTIPSVPI